MPLRLLATEQSGLDSRAQARRVASRLNLFRRAEVDFNGINEIGHSFADELFRVVAHEHPGLELVATHANARVAALLASVGR